MDEHDHGVLSVRDHGAVRVLELNRPRAHNALDRAVLERLAAELERAVGHVRALVVTGTGERAFCAGADLDELRAVSADAALARLSYGQEVLKRLERLPMPSIAAVNGVALGGGFELALACSFIVAGHGASFGLPETGLGLIPGYGGTQRLPRMIGLQAARRLVLTGERIDARRAWELGICSEPPVAAEELVDRAIELADGIGRRGPLATRLALAALRSAAVPDASLERESALAAIATASPESAEGVAAFLERRRPAFPEPVR